MGKKREEVRFGKVAAVMMVSVFMLLFFTYLVLFYNNEVSAKKTGEVMLNQISNVLVKNQYAEDVLSGSLKDEYTIRAKAVSYILNQYPEAEFNAKELANIAKLMSIDEIHLFDETGTIYAGSVPKYYGYSFDSGEQIGYFKPMLENKNLSMCQDVVPNTAEGKKMMYAITWDSSGTKMIQVGIEPVRLLEELRNSKVSNVIRSMPLHEDLNVYVTDVETGRIIGTTAYGLGVALEDMGVEIPEKAGEGITHFNAVFWGKRSLCSAVVEGEYLLCVVQNVRDIRLKTLNLVAFVAPYILIAACILLIVLHHLINIKKDQMEKLTILTSMADMYYSMHILDLESNRFTEYTSQEQVKEVVEKNGYEDCAATMRDVMYATMTDGYLERALEFSDISTLPERMKNKKVLFMDLLGKNVGWIRMSFISICAGIDGRPKKVICTTQIIDEEKRKEEQLIRESNTDELTQCFNRRAYENDLYSARDEEDLVIIAMDVNGLKRTNDSLGHDAGDELLVGAAECMKHSFGRYGRIYRTGGDEFIAMILADSHQLEELKKEFSDSVDNWSGTLVQNISVSCGYVAKRDFPDAPVSEMAKIADKRMYECKARYYEEQGK